MGKNLTRIVLLCALLAVLLSATAWAVVSSATLAADGKIHDVFTAADLLEMVGSSDTFYLRNDLDLTSWGNWTPIEFYGTFDGQGHIIKGVKIDGKTVDEDCGLFSVLNGSVKNLHLYVEINGNSEFNVNIGGLAGRMNNSRSSIECVSVSGKVSMIHNYMGQNLCVGGLVGCAQSGGRITNCYSNADVSIDFREESYSGTTDSCGGLAGSISFTTITNCYANGYVSYTGSNQIACDGLVGFPGGLNITRSYFCNYHDSKSTGGGIHISENAMKQQATYTGWDFSEIWDISPDVNDGFPFLRPPETIFPSSVLLDHNDLTLKVGNSQMLQATIAPVDANNWKLYWHSSNTDVVDLTPISDPTCGEITARMMINAKLPGVATVTATSADGNCVGSCVVTVPDASVQPAFRINSVTVQDNNGKELKSIPATDFLATVSVTNLTVTESPLIFLSAYTADGKYRGLMWVQVNAAPGATVAVTLPIDNTDGEIGELKAFAVTSFDDLTPIGNVISFPAA